MHVRIELSELGEELFNAGRLREDDQLSRLFTDVLEEVRDIPWCQDDRAFLGTDGLSRDVEFEDTGNHVERLILAMMDMRRRTRLWRSRCLEQSEFASGLLTGNFARDDVPSQDSPSGPGSGGDKFRGFDHGIGLSVERRLIDQSQLDDTENESETAWANWIEIIAEVYAHR